MLITIVDVSAMQSLVSAAGKPYKAMEVTYKNEQGQVASKKIMEFDKTLSKIFPLFVKGDVVNVTAVKEGDYWQWKNAVKSDGTVAQAQPSASTPATKAPSTYETSEERAKKQVYIVRQSSISAAINTLSVGAKAAPSVANIIETAKAFEDYVFGVEAVKPKAFDDFEDDIPL